MDRRTMDMDWALDWMDWLVHLSTQYLLSIGCNITSYMTTWFCFSKHDSLARSSYSAVQRVQIIDFECTVDSPMVHSPSLIHPILLLLDVCFLTHYATNHDILVAEWRILNVWSFGIACLNMSICQWVSEWVCQCVNVSMCQCEWVSVLCSLHVSIYEKGVKVEWVVCCMCMCVLLSFRPSFFLSHCWPMDIIPDSILPHLFTYFLTHSFSLILSHLHSE